MNRPLHRFRRYSNGPVYFGFAGIIFYMMMLVLASGCMQPETPVDPVVPPRPIVKPTPIESGLSGEIKANLRKKNAAIAALADLCKEKDASTTAVDEAKKMWNEEYHNIVTTSVADLNKIVKSASDAARMPEQRQALWVELQKGFAP